MRKYFLQIVLMKCVILFTVGCASKNTNKDYVVRGKDTLYIKYFDDGKTSVVADIKSGKFTGRYATFHENGKYKSTGSMVDSSKFDLWKTYDENESINEAILYYNDSIVRILDKDDFSFQRRITIGDKQIVIPAKWKTETFDTTSKIVLTARKNCEKIDKFCPTLVITKDALKNISFEEYIKDILKVFESSSSLRVVEQSSISINSMDAYQIKYMSKKSDIVLGNIVTIIKARNTVYIIDAASLNENTGDFLKYSSIFEEITNSFQEAK